MRGMFLKKATKATQSLSGFKKKQVKYWHKKQTCYNKGNNDAAGRHKGIRALKHRKEI